MKIVSDLRRKSSSHPQERMAWFMHAEQVSRCWTEMYCVSGCAMENNRSFESGMYTVTLPGGSKLPFSFPLCAYCGLQKHGGTYCECCSSAYYCNDGCRNADADYHQYVCNLRKVEREQAEAFTAYHGVERCGYCHKSAKEVANLSRCTSCCSIKYCGIECQQADKKVHIQECWMAQSVSESKYPQ